MENSNQFISSLYKGLNDYDDNSIIMSENVFSHLVKEFLSDNMNEQLLVECINKRDFQNFYKKFINLHKVVQGE